MRWIKFELEFEKGKHVPMKDWGQDHWSTLAYLETRTVDAKGMINNEKMRCNPRLHREFAHRGSFHPGGGEYPTLLKGDRKKTRHDDWSCLEEMVALGLVEAWWKLMNSGPIGGCIAKIKLTQRGRRICQELREFKANGGKKWGDFVPSQGAIS